MLTIWGRASSINVQKVMLAVGEVGVPYRRVDAGGNFGGLDDPEIAGRNPNRRVPVIDDDGFVLWESSAIVRYLASAYGRAALAPDSLQDHARADQWSDWAIIKIYPEIRTAYQGLTRYGKAERDETAIAEAAQRMGENLAVLDAHLADKAFIVGNRMSFADVIAGVYMYRYFAIDIARPALPNVEAWYQRLATRPAYQEHVMIGDMKAKA